jgi:hypothetical protein
MQDWYIRFLIPELQNKVRQNNRLSGKPEYYDLLASNSRKLVTHIEEMSLLLQQELPSALKTSLDSMQFDSSAVKLYYYLIDNIKNNFLAGRNVAVKMNDSLTRQIINDRGVEFLPALRDNFENEKLRSQVLAEDEISKWVENDHSIIRKLQPGFMKATSPNGRAHFFAPSRMIGRLEIDTFLFDLGVIWMITLILYITLYFKIPERLIDTFSVFR